MQWQHRREKRQCGTGSVAGRRRGWIASARWREKTGTEGEERLLVAWMERISRVKRLRCKDAGFRANSKARRDAIHCASPDLKWLVQLHDGWSDVKAANFQYRHGSRPPCL